MRDGPYWDEVNQRLAILRGEADTIHQLQRAGLSNGWARLLPPLRRLEDWTERHAGAAQHRTAHSKAAGTR